MTVFALLGSAALWLMYLWLLSAIVASYLSERKGYGEKVGLAFGLLLSFVGTVIWLVWPPKPESKWKRIGPWGRGKDTEERLAAVEAATHHDSGPLAPGDRAVEHHRPIAQRRRAARAGVLTAEPGDAVRGRERAQLALRGVERRRRQGGEGDRAGHAGEREAAAPALRGRDAPGGDHEVVAEAGEVGREVHDSGFALRPSRARDCGRRYVMARDATVCHAPPPQAAGTRSVPSRTSPPSPGRPVILQKAKRPLGKSTSARYG